MFQEKLRWWIFFNVTARLYQVWVKLLDRWHKDEVK